MKFRQARGRAVSAESETRREFLRKSAALGAGVVLGGGLLGACGDDDGNGATQAAGDNGGDGGENVLMLLDVPPYGKHAPWFVPAAQEYWAEQGLNIDIQGAQGSADSVAKVASKAADIGFADTGTLIVTRGNAGVRVKEVCMYHYKNLQCCLYNKAENPIPEPSALEGKKVAGSAGDASFVLLDALAKINNFDASTVEKTPTPTPNHVSSVVTGAVDGALTYNTFFPALLENLQDDAGSWLYADWGIDIYNNGIIVHEDMLAEKPDVVKSFNEGFARGVKWTVENPDDAAEIFIESQPAGEALSFDIARAQLQIAIDHLLVPEVTDVGIGPMREDKMQQTLDLITEYFDLENPVKLDEVFSNEFVPEGIIPAV
jgi:NitT/TauT family transport system substrate-binding protein